MKRYKSRLIKTRQSYTTKQLADLLGVHVRTIQEWTRLGLKFITNSKPLLFMGSEARQYLKDKQNSYKIKLEANQFYCMKCRRAVYSFNNQIEFIYTGKKLGKTGDDELILKGICELCETTINRFSHAGKLQEIQTTFTILNMEDLQND